VNVDRLASVASRRLGTRRYAPTLTPERDGWRAGAACLSVGTDLFYPDKGGHGAVAARRVCAGCLVRAECLAFGLRDEWGVYGGMSARERRRLARSGWVLGDPLPPVTGRADVA
jgi:WhiB family redox-sensing transcriptional regulator